jgi:hypothetical protein
MNNDIALVREQQAHHAHDEYPGVLGDENGNVYASISRYWVRFPQGADANGIMTYGLARPIRYVQGAVIAKAGIEVLVEKDRFDGIETITRMRPGYFDDAHIDSRIFNAGEPTTKWWDSRNFIRWLNRPSGSASSPSTLVTTRENPFYWNDAQDWAQFAATTPGNQLDLSSYIPAAGYHRLVITYVDILLGTTAVVGSTAKTLATALDFNDYLECRGLLPHNECMPLTAYELADAQTAIDGNDVVEELRSWIALPAVMGIPNFIPDGTNWLLREDYQMLVAGFTVEGGITIEGSLITI